MMAITRQDSGDQWLQKDRTLICPSLMCADLLRLGEQVRHLEKAGADAFHMDIMDGHFVDNLALNFDILRQVRAVTSLPVDAHLMVENPEDYITAARKAGADLIIFHQEAARFPLRILHLIKDTGALAGIALNPATPVALIQPLLEQVQMVLVMTVEPGFAGQKLIHFTLKKITELARIRQVAGLDFVIGVDGAVSAQVAGLTSQLGASFFVGGTSGVFRPECAGAGESEETGFRAAIEKMRQAVQVGQQQGSI